MEECTVCLELLKENIYPLNCGHIYHQKCITQWLAENPTCPICRHPVDADQRYVDDGIITELRLAYIASLGKVLLGVSQGLESYFPSLAGSTEFTREILESPDGQELLRQVGETIQSPELSFMSRLILTLGGNNLKDYKHS